MDKALIDLLTPMLILDEQKRRFPYTDTSRFGKKTTIGIGRNLTDKGLSEDEIMYLFKHDMQEAEAIARVVFGNLVFDSLSPNRQAVVVDMAFNLGLDRFLQFHSTVFAIKAGNFIEARNFMLHSLWAQQVGSRADRLAKLMLDG